MSIEAGALDSYRVLLLDRRAQLTEVARTNDAAAEVVELDQSRIGRLSRMDAMQSQAMSIEIKRRNEQELKAIGAALRRIDDEVYGECLRCEEEISAARLRANPVATLCIECAERRPR
jgi:DnaK suppressor protein